MNRLIMFTIDEYKKLMLQTKTKVIIVLFALCAIAIGMVAYFVESSTGVQMVAPGRLPVFVLELLTGFILPIVVIFTGSELLASEFKDGTMKNLFALPVPKSIIYLGKMLSGTMFTGTCLLVLGIVSLAASVVLNGTAAFGNLGGFLVSYLGAFLYLMVVLAISSFITLLTGSAGMAIIMNLLVWFVIGVAGTFITAVRQYLPTSFADWYHPLVSGVHMTAALPPLLYMVSYCAIFIVVGLTIFERKEV